MFPIPGDQWGYPSLCPFWYFYVICTNRARIKWDDWIRYFQTIATDDEKRCQWKSSDRFNSRKGWTLYWSLNHFHLYCRYQCWPAWTLQYSFQNYCIEMVRNVQTYLRTFWQQTLFHTKASSRGIEFDVIILKYADLILGLWTVYSWILFASGRGWGFSFRFRLCT